jgi:prepilin-type processing-associated H-X9-DG protein
MVNISSRSCVATLILLCVSANPATSFAAPVSTKNQTPSPVDLSSPKATVQSFFAALNRYDWRRAAQCILDAQPHASLDAWMEGYKEDKSQFHIRKIAVKTTGNQVAARVYVTEKGVNRISIEGVMHQENLSIDSESLFKFHLVNNEWKIDPGPQSSLGEPDSNVLTNQPEKNTLLFSVVNLIAYAAPRHKIYSVPCFNHLKTLASVTLTRSFNSNEEFILDNTSWSNTLKVHLFKNKHSYLLDCPWDGKRKVDYSLNTNLKGLLFDDIFFSNRIPMIYEGRNQQLDYRHDGGAYVAFTDSHVELVSPEQEKFLIWKPEKIPI